LRVKRICPDEYPQLLKLLEIVNIAPEEYFFNIYYNDPYDNISYSLVIEEDGEMLSHVRFFYRPHHGAMLPLISGALANVGTLENQRGKGYCRKLLETSIEIMKKEGYDYSTVLSGVPVYAKCGWEEVPVPSYTLQLEQIQLDLPEGYRIRRFCPDADTDELYYIYLSFNHLRPLCVDRSRQYWIKHLNWAQENRDIFLVAEKDNRINAYMRGRGTGDNVEIFEMAHREGCEEAYLPLINAMVRYIDKYGWKNVRLNLPSDHPFLKIAGKYFRITCEMKKGLLLRLVNLKQILTKMQYNFQDNLNRIDTVPDAKYKISCNNQQAALEIKNGIVKVTDNIENCKEIILSQQKFFSLIFRFTKFSELEAAKALSDKDVDLLDVMFDGKKAVYWGPDRV